MRCLVTGCAGFIGSHLVDRLLADGHEVIGIDNFATGREAFISEARGTGRFTIVNLDLTFPAQLERYFVHSDVVFHFSANADVRWGTQHPRKDLEQNTVVTHNVLEAMRLAGVRRIVFASTGSVYGQPAVLPTPEDAPFPIQTSLYGASKLACEGLIAAYCEGFEFRSWIFRLVSVLGKRYTHGHVIDFLRQLAADPTRLVVLGDGTQRKSYVHVGDCIDAVMTGFENASGSVNVFNVGLDASFTVRQSIDRICDHVGLHPDVEYTGGDRGWVGDNPFILLAADRLRALGWRPKHDIRDSLTETVDYLWPGRLGSDV